MRAGFKLFKNNPFRRSDPPPQDRPRIEKGRISDPINLRYQGAGSDAILPRITGMPQGGEHTRPGTPDSRSDSSHGQAAPSRTSPQPSVYAHDTAPGPSGENRGPRNWASAFSEDIQWPSMKSQESAPMSHGESSGTVPWRNDTALPPNPLPVRPNFHDMFSEAPSKLPQIGPFAPEGEQRPSAGAIARGNQAKVEKFWQKMDKEVTDKLGPGDHTASRLASKIKGDGLAELLWESPTVQAHMSPGGLRHAANSETLPRGAEPGGAHGRPTGEGSNP